MYTIDDLQYLMSRLRDPLDGCPWDQKQTYASIAPSTLEEAYEVVDTIERGDLAHLREELGDLLFQVIFYSQLGVEEGRFSFDEIVMELCAKLVRRHPHVFPGGDLHSRTGTSGDDDPAIKARWEAIKQEERQAKGAAGILDDIPLNLPALSRAAKLQKRAAAVGFDWQEVTGPIAKVREELSEVEQALQAGDRDALEDELGDLLFAVTNVSRFLRIDAEAALRRANRKFEQRFRQMEARSDRPLSEMDAEGLDRLWEEAKTQSGARE